MAEILICGMEHSGTTLLSDLVRQTGKFESGFECGVLLAETPHEFMNVSPFYNNMLAGWKISQEELDHCCDTDSFDEFYDRLKDCSELLTGDLEIFDKTPRYIANLEHVAKRSTAQILAIYKDPRASVYSDYKRAGSKPFGPWFESYAPNKIKYMKRCYSGNTFGETLGKRYLSISLEDLCFRAFETAEKMFSHLGLQFDLDYLLFNKLRYANTRAKFVSAEITLEYRRGFSKAQQKSIEDAFSEFSEWFFQ